MDSEDYTPTMEKVEEGIDRLRLQNFRQKHDFGDFQILTESPVKIEQETPLGKPMHKPAKPLKPTPQQLHVKRQILKKSFSIDV